MPEHNACNSLRTHNATILPGSSTDNLITSPGCGPIFDGVAFGAFNPSASLLKCEKTLWYAGEIIPHCADMVPTCYIIGSIYLTFNSKDSFLILI